MLFFHNQCFQSSQYNVQYFFLDAAQGKGRHLYSISRTVKFTGGGGGSTPYNGLYREAPLERGTFFRLQVYETVGKSFICVYKKAHNG